MAWVWIIVFWSTQVSFVLKFILGFIFFCLIIDIVACWCSCVSPGHSPVSSHHYTGQYHCHILELFLGTTYSTNKINRYSGKPREKSIDSRSSGRIEPATCMSCVKQVFAAQPWPSVDTNKCKCEPKVKPRHTEICLKKTTLWYFGSEYSHHWEVWKLKYFFHWCFTPIINKPKGGRLLQTFPHTARKSPWAGLELAAST